MNPSPFCKACNQKVEWHQTAAGRWMLLDPEPHPEGRFAFDGRLRVIGVPPGSRPRTYRCHYDTCPKGNA